MPSSDYTSAVGGGLKLKGAKDAGVKKHKKKKPKSETGVSKPTETEKEPEAEGSTALQKLLAEEDVEDMQGEGSAAKTSKDKDTGTAKTEAQRKHEEMRRKRLDDRLKREGVKTHKERVEELNKYLSGLSEHHDMPRIGPG